MERKNGTKLLLALLAGVTALMTLAPAGAVSTKTPEWNDEVMDCYIPGGGAVGAYVPAVDQIVDLDVHVLLDGVTQARAEQIVAAAYQTYAPLGINFKAVAYQAVTPPTHDLPEADGPLPAPFNDIAAEKAETGVDAFEAIAYMKSLFPNGERPAGSDIVYMLTDKNLFVRIEDPIAGTVETRAVAGLADCIGGVRMPNRAFAVGEDITWSIREPFAQIQLSGATDGIVMAHEIGHLMGGQHHYANCAEGVSASDVDNKEFSPCGIMSNFADFNSENFDTVNSSMVRGHAEEFADNH
ncbi:MAG TPA: zinc-dependent metalloprotease family protein [Actinomycetota bacterium]|nr:zinc-dependent metalloprotease family protein [Actinomycetota bacterium]